MPAFVEMDGAVQSYLPDYRPAGHGTIATLWVYEPLLAFRVDRAGQLRIMISVFVEATFDEGFGI
jgi:hypothetical protein